MKKLLLMASAALIASSSVMALSPYTPNFNPNKKLPLKENFTPPEVAPEVNALTQLEDTGDVTAYRTFFNGEFDPNTNLGSANMMISFEPISGTLAILNAERETGQPNAEGGRPFIGSSFDVYTTNLEELKAAAPIETVAQLMTYYNIDSSFVSVGPEVGRTGLILTEPAIAVLNPDGNTMDSELLSYIVVGQTSTIERTSSGGISFDREGVTAVLKDANNGITFADDFARVGIEGPDGNNPAPRKVFNTTNFSGYQGDYGQGWEYGGIGSSLLYEPNEVEASSPTGDGVSFGTSDDNNYGFMNLNVGNISFESTIPQSWQNDTWRSGGFHGNYLTVDRPLPGNGTTIWAGVSGWFSVDPTNRNFAMSWSTDGITFSDWARMSLAELQTEYIDTRPEFAGLAGYEININSNPLPYAKYDFIALNDNEASLFVQVLYGPAANTPGTTYNHLVQITYNRSSDSWRAEKVADLYTPFRWELLHRSFFQESALNDANINLDWFYDTQSYASNSIDVSRNSNGDIAVKYIKVTDTIPLENPIPIFWANTDGDLVIPEDNILDEVEVDEIFISYKEAGADGWKEYQITRDGDRVHYYSQMPDRFESRRTIPFLEHVKIDPTRYNPGDLRDRLTSLPESLNSLYRPTWTEAFVGWADLDTIRGDVSVEEQAPAMNMEITKISPNPASDLLSVSFTLDNSADVNMYLSNSTGQKVLDIYNGKAYALTIKNNIDVSGLPGGAYFLTMEANGQNVTKLVQITR